MKQWVLALCVVVGCGNGDGKEAAGSGEASAPGMQKVETPSAEQEALRAAQAAKEAAVKRAAEARARLDKIERELGELETQLEAVVQQTVDAKSDAERTAAQQALEQLRAQQKALQARAAQVKADAAAAERMKGAQLTKECIDNPLAKGCM